MTSLQIINRIKLNRRWGISPNLHWRQYKHRGHTSLCGWMGINRNRAKSSRHPWSIDFLLRAVNSALGFMINPRVMVITAAGTLRGHSFDQLPYQWPPVIVPLGAFAHQQISSPAACHILAYTTRNSFWSHCVQFTTCWSGSTNKPTQVRNDFNTFRDAYNHNPGGVWTNHPTNRKYLSKCGGCTQ